jgi:RNA polymerase sigma factor (sigma-70 family)
VDNRATANQLYQNYKPMLFALAYRMLGSVMDAEDVIQEAFISFNSVDLETIQNSKAYLCKIVTNRCIDRLRVLSKQREVYIGPWLPEPLIMDANAASDPSQAFMQKESISTAYLILLQQLSWVERAVFLLREVLAYEYDEIADVVGRAARIADKFFIVLNAV